MRPVDHNVVAVVAQAQSERAGLLSMSEDVNPEALDLDAAHEQVQERRLLEALDRDGEVRQLAGLLQQEAVRDVFWRILAKCSIYQSTYNKNFGDMALAEGKRQVGLWLLAEVCEADASAEMLMRRKAIALEHQKKSPRRKPSQA